MRYLFPYLFLTQNSDLQASPPCQLFIWAEDVSPCQSASGSEDFLTISNNLSLIQSPSVCSGLNLNLLNCVECWFSFYRSAYPTDHSFISTETLTRFYSVSHLSITIDESFKWFFHIFNCTKYLRRLSFDIKRLRHFRVKQNTICQFVN